MDCKNTYCAVVLGAYVNGYDVVRELNDNNVENIAVFYYKNTHIAANSNIPKYKLKIDKTSNSLKAKLIQLGEKYDYLVVYPTDDSQLENLSEIYDEINHFCFLPFNNTNLKESLDKYIQYKFCDKLGIPYPKTFRISSKFDFHNAPVLKYPIIIKPIKRDDIKVNVFRSLRVQSKDDWKLKVEKIQKLVNKGIEFIGSEIIPGDTNGTIYAYVGYRSSKTGVILNEWIGKKLTQYPDDYGVFSSASNQSPEIIADYGRKLLNEMDLFGICEPEFKFDYRDNSYNLMEINLRSMMWHRVGNLSNVNLQYTQWQDAIGESPIKNNQNKEDIIHYAFLNHELANLMFRKKYFKYFKANIFGGDANQIAVFNRKDLKPFFFSIYGFIKLLLSRILKK